MSSEDAFVSGLSYGRKLISKPTGGRNLRSWLPKRVKDPTSSDVIDDWSCYDYAVQRGHDIFR